MVISTFFYFKKSLAEWNPIINNYSLGDSNIHFQCQKSVEPFWLGPNFVGSPSFHSISKYILYQRIFWNISLLGKTLWILHPRTWTPQPVLPYWSYKGSIWLILFQEKLFTYYLLANNIYKKKFGESVVLIF